MLRTYFPLLDFKVSAGGGSALNQNRRAGRVGRGDVDHQCKDFDQPSGLLFRPIHPAFFEEESSQAGVLPCHALNGFLVDVLIGRDDNPFALLGKGGDPVFVRGVGGESVTQMHDQMPLILNKPVEGPRHPGGQAVIDKELHAARLSSNRTAAFTEGSGISYQCATLAESPWLDL